MKEFKIAFWTPGTELQPNQQLFGCASHGFATESSWIEPNMGEYSIWDETIKGNVFSGPPLASSNAHYAVFVIARRNPETSGKQYADNQL